MTSTANKEEVFCNRPKKFFLYSSNNLETKFLVDSEYGLKNVLSPAIASYDAIQKRRNLRCKNKVPIPSDQADAITEIQWTNSFFASFESGKIRCFLSFPCMISLFCRKPCDIHNCHALHNLAKTFDGPYCSKKSLNDSNMKHCAHKSLLSVQFTIP